MNKCNGPIVFFLVFLIISGSLHSIPNGSFLRQLLKFRANPEEGDKKWKKNNKKKENHII